MFKIKTFNKIADVGLQQFPAELYEVGPDVSDPDAIICRSQNLQPEDIPASVQVIARAGAGVNNIPVADMTKAGVVVLNTPGANANAVKELVISAMLLGSRNIVQGWDFMQRLDQSASDLHEQVEKNKKQFIGFELSGRTLGIIGLGAIGVKVANAAIGLGMNVLGFDPMITVQRAWELSANVVQADTVEQLLKHCDIISIHVPLVEATCDLINAERLALMKDNAMLINFARDGIVDDVAIKHALDNNKIQSYVTDFASDILIGNKKVIALPHLGASTHEAEQNCAVMAVTQCRQWLEEGRIHNSVNFPEMHIGQGAEYRLAVINRNIPNMVSKISGVLGDHNVNIVDLLNKSREEIAYTLIDVNEPIPDTTLNEIKSIDGVLRARTV